MVARVSAELGARVVKTYYCKEKFEKVIEGCPVPVVIAGGPKAKTDADVLQTTFEAIQAGGSGLSIGRNVFQHEKPALMVQALAAIVHESATADQAQKILGGNK